MRFGHGAPAVRSRFHGGRVRGNLSTSPICQCLLYLLEQARLISCLFQATNEALTKANIQYEALAQEHARGVLLQEAKREPEQESAEHEKNGRISRMDAFQDEDSEKIGTQLGASVQVGEGAGATPVRTLLCHTASSQLHVVVRWSALLNI